MQVRAEWDEVGAAKTALEKKVDGLEQGLRHREQATEISARGPHLNVPAAISRRDLPAISRRSPGDLHHVEQEVESLRRKKYAKENELAQLEAAVEKKARPMRCRCDDPATTTR